jgi:hypothetical protein
MAGRTTSESLRSPPSRILTSIPRPRSASWVRIYRTTRLPSPKTPPWTAGLEGHPSPRRRDLLEPPRPAGSPLRRPLPLPGALPWQRPRGPLNRLGAKLSNRRAPPRRPRFRQSRPRPRRAGRSSPRNQHRARNPGRSPNPSRNPNRNPARSPSRLRRRPHGRTPLPLPSRPSPSPILPPRTVPRSTIR